MKLDNMAGSNGDLSFSLSNLRTDNVYIPKSHLSLSPEQKGFTLSVSYLSMKVSVDYSAKYQLLLIPIYNSGSVSASFDDVSLTFTVGIDETGNSVPKIVPRDCSATIGDFQLTFNGNMAWILNLFNGHFKGDIRQTLNDKICPSVINAINIGAEQISQQMTLEAVIANKFVFDYHLTAPIIINTNYLESQHKGAMYWKVNRQDIIPFSSEPILDKNQTDNNMINIWMTEYPLKTMTYFAHKYNFLTYTISTDNMPEQYKNFLQTTCIDTICVGMVIPKLAQYYPRSRMTIQIKSSQAPDVNLTTNGLGLNLKAGLELSVDRPNGVLESVLLANVTVSVAGFVNFRGDLIVGNITQFAARIDSFTFPVGDFSQVEDIDKDTINSGIDGMKMLIIKKINEAIKDGFPLPVIPDILLRNSKIIYKEKYFIVATDVQYQGIV